jgi:hypothetical protein
MSNGGPPRHQHGKDASAAGNRTLNDPAIIRRSRNDRDTPRELLELVHTDLAAHRDDLVTPVQREPHHVAPELARGPDDTDLSRGRPGGFAPILRCFQGFSLDGSWCIHDRLLSECIQTPAETVAI